MKKEKYTEMEFMSKNVSDLEYILRKSNIWIEGFLEWKKQRNKKQ